MVFQDSDVAKWLEAGVAYYSATGKTTLLNVVKKFSDHIDDVFSGTKEKLLGYPGHPEIELALMRLFEVTKEERYSKLCQFFIEQRGQEPHYYDVEYQKRGSTSYWHTYGPAWMVNDKAYSQAHMPVNQQRHAVGHAVRFVYLLSGVAHLARISRDQEKLNACKVLWRNMVDKQMYITGGIGSQSEGESFSCDYDLPNDTAYTETCASIGLMMFANRMLQLETNSNYGDVMERALYNTVLAGMALDGQHFFYVNPLEVHPNSIAHNHIYDHVKPVRQQWFGCACCPPNIARLIGSIGNYIYTEKNNTVLVNLYIANEADFQLPNGHIALIQQGDYPWRDRISLQIQCEQEIEMEIGLRIPDWCAHAEIKINDIPQKLDGLVRHGYAHISQQWKDGDKIELHLPMETIIVRANPLLRHNHGKVAIQRGPLVYCIEQADNGSDLHNVELDTGEEFVTEAGDGLFVGQTLLKANAKRIDCVAAHNAPLYQYNQPKPQYQPQKLLLIPYFSWANRGEGEMRVWINEYNALM